jgi:hypothetical protein
VSFWGAQASRLPVEPASAAAEMAALPGLTHVKTTGEERLKAVRRLLSVFRVVVQVPQRL